jgi:hypothetical protein
VAFLVLAVQRYLLHPPMANNRLCATAMVAIALYTYLHGPLRGVVYVVPLSASRTKGTILVSVICIRRAGSVIREGHWDWSA